MIKRRIQYTVYGQMLIVSIATPPLQCCCPSLNRVLAYAMIAWLGMSRLQWHCQKVGTMSDLRRAILRDWHGACEEVPGTTKSLVGQAAQKEPKGICNPEFLRNIDDIQEPHNAIEESKKSFANNKAWVWTRQTGFRASLLLMLGESSRCGAIW